LPAYYKISLEYTLYLVLAPTH